MVPWTVWLLCADQIQAFHKETAMRAAQMMRVLRVIAGTAIAALAHAPATAMPDMRCGQGQGATFLVKAEGLKDRSGRVILELYPANQDDFLKKREELLRDGKIFRRVEATVPPHGPVSLCIAAPRPGAYALIFIHDRDGKDKFNIWKDGIGLPGGKALGTFRPRVSQATVLADNTTVAVPIQVQYMNGAGGFGPQRH
jgi:uncharacterized protein (DUF2141 family)